MTADIMTVTMNKIMLFIFISILALCESSRKIGTFWHISDVYWKTHNDDCTENFSACIENFLTGAIERHVNFQPDFMLWSNAGGSRKNVVITKLKQYLDVTVFPSLPPITDLPTSNRSLLYYQEISNSFGEWLDEAAHTTFWKAGYYTQILDIPRDLQIIVLNTALFCNFHETSIFNDPGYQWTWLTMELAKAQQAKRKVYILLSATPGVVKNYENRMFAPKHNHRYIKVVSAYADVIKGQFGGYEEADKFHIFYDTKERGCNWLMVAPYFYKGARLYLYDTETFEPVDYIQYYRKGDEWNILYRFTSYYRVPNLSVSSLQLLVKKLPEEEDIFIKYALANQKSIKPYTSRMVCRTKKCIKSQFCSIVAVDYHAYTECMDPARTSLYLARYNTGLIVSVSELYFIKCFFFIIYWSINYVFEM